LILPLYIPVLVYGAGAVTVGAVALGEAQPYLTLLAAFLVAALALAPVACAAALRISIE
jgi:heme exporter protein B